MKRLPCNTCPWRPSTPPHGFPGGHMSERILRCAGRDAWNPDFTLMQCHCTADRNPGVCVGFALVVGFDSLGLRLAVCAGLVDMDQLDTDEHLLTLDQVVERHGLVD